MRSEPLRTPSDQQVAIGRRGRALPSSPICPAALNLPSCT